LKKFMSQDDISMLLSEDIWEKIDGLSPYRVYFRVGGYFAVIHRLPVFPYHVCITASEIKWHLLTYLSIPQKWFLTHPVANGALILLLHATWPVSVVLPELESREILNHWIMTFIVMSFKSCSDYAWDILRGHKN
jgi:hypothetical protein